MKVTTCLAVLAILIVFGQFAGQQISAGFPPEDALAQNATGLLRWAFPAVGFLGVMFFSARKWRLKPVESAVADSA